MKAKPTYLTPKGIAKIEAQITELRNGELVKLSELLTEAQVGSDLQDNTEYLNLLEQLAFVQLRINELEKILKTARLIEYDSPDGRVHPGSTVVIQNGGIGPETYRIVGSAETEPEHGYISYECPLGHSLLGHEAGDDVNVKTPDGTIHYHIISVK